MSDKYYRGLRNILNDTKHKLQLASMTLKINENKNSISGIKNDISEINNFSDKINDNETNISDNLGKINNNKDNIADNLGKINNIENDLVDFKINYSIQNLFMYNIDIEKEIILDINNSKYTIFSYNIEDDFKSNSYLELNCNILYDYAGYDHIGRLNHIFKFYDKNNTLFHEIKFLKTNAGDNLKDNLNQNDLFYVKINNNYSIIKIELTLGFLHIPNNGMKINIINPLKSNYLCIKHYKKINTLSINNNLTDLESSISSNLQDIETNQSNISSNSGLINTNTSSIASNLLKINKNTDDITALQNSNIKAFYNLDQIFIYDIEKGNQTVNKDNHFHIFEKEITYNFIKNSYLEIALKVLTEISNYVLIGFFQILCNFYDQDNNLFYTISLSTAMGSINKLSTIKSVFIVPINENMDKIKIDFFIAPKETQQNRSATFIIQDINSNKIYIKYFQKTDEMSIKSIQNSLDNVKLKNIKNILFYDEKKQIDFKNDFFNKTYNLNAKKDDFIEIDLRMLLEYKNIDNSNIIITEFRLYNDDDDQIYTAIYNNGDNISFTNFVFINKNIFYNFEKDVSNLRIEIFFYMLRSEIVNIHYIPKNTDRFILKHYGN